MEPMWHEWAPSFFLFHQYPLMEGIAIALVNS